MQKQVGEMVETGYTLAQAYDVGLSFISVRIAVVHVTAIIRRYGCMSLSDNFYGPSGLSEEEASALLMKAYALGVRLYNTSDLYGPYTNEALLVRETACGHTTHIKHVCFKTDT